MLKSLWPWHFRHQLSAAYLPTRARQGGALMAWVVQQPSSI